MRLRPGSKYLGSSASDAAAAWIEFVAATDDTALIELTDAVLRVWIDDALITRPSVATTISNGDFASSAGWTDASTGGGVVAFGGGAGGGLRFNATNLGGVAKVTRQITVTAPAQNIEHALAMNVPYGPVMCRVGSTAGGDDYVTETPLGTGRHSLAFTPTGDFYLTFWSDERLAYNVHLYTIAIEAVGVMAVVAPWASANLDDIRTEQSADVVWVACNGVQQYRIERRGTGRSWSIVKYAPLNGPFLSAASSKALLQPSATYGNVFIVASQSFFRPTHVGALFRIFHDGQNWNGSFGASGTYSDVWEVTGVGSTTERRSVVTTTGFGTANLYVQKSSDGPDTGFHTVATITTNTTTNVDDADDNLSVWYRLAIPLAADFTSGPIVVTMTYVGGGKDGIARVTDYSSGVLVSAQVLSPFSGATPSPNWVEGAWSSWQGFPTSVALDGRLFWFGGPTMYASVSDDYENFDDTTEGDSGPITRTIGRGPVDTINFALPLQRMAIGTAGSEIAIQSSSFDEPLTPTNANAKTVSTQGSAMVRAVAVDSSGVFVQRSGKRVCMLAFDPNKGNYATQELTLLVPELLAAGVVSIAVQRQPDTRLHFVLGDGSVAVLTYEESESVLCWTLYKSTAASGYVIAAMVLPGTDEDQVYYHVQRTISGSTKRYLERQADEDEAEGAATNWMADCAVQITQASSTTVAGLSHLEGQKVIVWKSSGSGKDLSPDVANVQTTYTVSGGGITVTEAVTSVIVGLPYMDKATDEYSAKYKSTKLAYGAAAGTALTMPKRVDHLGLVLGLTHNNGLYFGKDFSSLLPMPRVINGRTISDVDEIFTTTTDIVPEPFSGDFDTDARFCLAAKAPRPCTILAGVVGMASNDVI